jgi:hypothetical protein
MLPVRFVFYLVCVLFLVFVIIMSKMGFLVIVLNRSFSCAIQYTHHITKQRHITTMNKKKKKILNNMQMTCTGRNSRTTDHF